LKAGHSFNHWSTGSDGTPGLVSFEMRNDDYSGRGSQHCYEIMWILGDFTCPLSD
jgi:hypothetical protein